MTRDQLRAYGAKLAEQTPPLPVHVLDQAAAIYVAALAKAEPHNSRSAG